MAKQRNFKYSIPEIQKIAKANSGKLLSKEYKNAHSKLEWQFKNGHKWKTPLANIIQGKWCPLCAIEKNRLNKIKYDINSCHELAEKRNGKFLSSEYLGYQVKHDWSCSKGHNFKAQVSKVKSGNWCPTCAGRNKTIKDANNLAKERGGACLSKKYVSVKDKMLWKCKNNHKWEASFDNILRGSWCPHCSGGKGEELLRNMIEQLFQKPFPKTRPEWLKSDKGIKMELDGFNAELGIAFEHQGLFHYKKVSYFGTKNLSFEKRIELDERKKRICDEHGIKIIYIPEIGKLTKQDKLAKLIYEELDRLNIIAPIRFEDFNPNLNLIFANRNDTKFDEIKELVKRKNGTLISKSYLGSLFKIEVKCKCNHQWKISYHNLKKGKWCPVCHGNNVITIDQLKRIAAKMGGKCLSTTYINNRSHLAWECSEGHRWAALPTNILRGTWCPVCNTGKQTNNDLLEKTLAKTTSKT